MIKVISRYPKIRNSEQLTWLLSIGDLNAAHRCTKGSYDTNQKECHLKNVSSLIKSN